MKKFFCTLYSIRWKLLNYAIILLLLYQIIYCAVTFLYIVPEGMGPTMSLWRRAGQVPDEILYKRRLYAIELWVSATALIVYIAIVYKNKLGEKISKLVKSAQKDESDTKA
ncbi:MAG: hypothetical protein GX095_05675 [Clostridiales bacterium]|jgi:hypothetical protein|nr:hypothetical protein [Clostridiales bacterium]HOB63808.1 hypothetical protein [Clostridia bacterium]HOK81134.1 hypothetical protein [Clostridia bacterium]HOL60253.1 hypothetical protein [Clostridia bacterium]HPO53786.1 hypothetical protein [Clostridia bacterium]